MTQFYYGGAYLMKRAGRRSMNSFYQLRHRGFLPAPEIVLVSGRPASGWTLETWKKCVKSLEDPLRGDLLKVIKALEKEEAQLAKEHETKNAS